MSKLYIVGTPIGNMQDMTFRALETLKKVSVIACEDTRVSMKLLNHFEIKGKRLLAHHDKNEKRSTNGLVEILKSGEEIALISDAGMPTINDPGFLLIRESLANNIDVEVIPGVSAPTMVAALANFDPHYSFKGFFGYTEAKRIKEMKTWTVGTYIIFCSPHRIVKDIEAIRDFFGNEIKIFVGRELTKKFETHYRGTVDEVLAAIESSPIKGEFTVAVSVTKEIYKNVKQ